MESVPPLLLLFWGLLFGLGLAVGTRQALALSLPVWP